MKTRRRSTIIFGILGISAGLMMTTSFFFTRAAEGLEKPGYEILRSDQAIEIRAYPATAAAAVTVPGERGAATRKAFRILFRYISGGNTPKEEIAMTAPVRQQQAGTKIAMTAPVRQAEEADGTWQVAFYLPGKYTAETAPEPEDDRIELVTFPGEKVATIRFSGRWTDANFESHLKKLTAYMDSNGLVAAGPPVYAYYNDPFTLPPFRRNEVQIPLK